MSQLPGPAPVAPRDASIQLSQSVSGRTESLYQLSLTQHPLYQSIVSGRVSKAPMFYSGYTGPRRLDLDVVGANAKIIPQQGFLLTGKVLGPIDPSQPAIYSFLINRGGASSPGPIKDRPMIYYDSVVKVTTGPGGSVGTVSLLDSQGQARSTIALPAGAVQIAGDTVNLSVPANLLPSTSPPHTHLRITRDFYAFTAAVPGGSASNIAGFAPEYAITQVDASVFRNS